MMVLALRPPTFHEATGFVARTIGGQANAEHNFQRVSPPFGALLGPEDGIGDVEFQQAVATVEELEPGQGQTTPPCALL